MKPLWEKPFKRCLNILIAFVRLILITVFHRQLHGDIYVTLKNRNLGSECIQKRYGDKADRCDVCGVWLMDKLIFQRWNIIGPFRVNSQEVARSPSPIFLKFYSNCHYPRWWTSAKREWNLSRNGMIIKLFSWGCLAEGEQIVHIWPCLKPYYRQTTWVNNPNILGMLVTLPNIEKMTLFTLWLSKVKGHGHPKLTVSRSHYKFSKNFKPRHGFISWYFPLIFRRIVANKIISDLRKFYCKISKGLRDILSKLGTKWKN